jgi:hypothetical protein
MATMTSSLTGTTQQQQQAVDLRPLLRAVAKAEIWQGVKLFAIGTAITAGTYMIAPGGLFLISFAPIYGVYHVLHGVYKLAAA